MVFHIRSKVMVTKDEMSAFGDLTSSLVPRMGFGMPIISRGI